MAKNKGISLERIKKIEQLVPNPFGKSSNPVGGRFRKPKSVRTMHSELIRAKIAAFTASKIDGVLEAMEQSATGNVTVWQDTKDGRYEKSLPPSVEAAKLLIENASGRPTQQVEMKAMVGIVDLVSQLEEND